MEDKDDLYTIPNEAVYDGMTIPRDFINEQSIERAKSFKAEPGDVIVASYPRSGSVWMSEATYMVLSNGDLETARKFSIHERYHFLESADNTRAYYQSKFDVRLLKTHLPVRYVENKIGNPDVRLIVVLRNPKDTLVSYFHLHETYKHFGRFDRGWNEYFRLFQNKRLTYGDWLEHVTGYWGLQGKENVLFVYYEDALADTKATLRKIAKFLGKDLTLEKIDEIAEYIKFDAMQSNPMTNGSVLVKMGLVSKENALVRKGKVGQWKTYFTVAQDEYVNQHYVKPCIDMGLKLKFE